MCPVTVFDINPLEDVSLAAPYSQSLAIHATFLEPAQVRPIDTSPLLIRVCGTVYHFLCLILN